MKDVTTLKDCKGKVCAWREQVVIPTYEIGKAEKNPIFLEKRVYQGSSGVVYPYPVIESISDEKVDKVYNAVFIENEYIKVMVLPELGGRVQMAYDKIKKRHFIYYNHVIKPALVGLAGPWISGGIEFNWPQHHRPSTFMAVDCTISGPAAASEEDGISDYRESTDEVTVWVNERERMFHQQGQAGFTLRAGCAYLEIKGKLYNPTETPQTFLWWANPAVAVNDEYQSVFPPDVNAVFDHGKRAVSSFPIATGTYYKMDYSAGVDISNYRNIFVPTSYMVAKSKYNFEGGYENDTQAGMLHVADHHIAPGKKQWTWGNGDFGRAWDRALTDEDGPYIELMAGVYTENQPDFTWLMPYEEKNFVQYFMPYRELGVVKNASKDFMINVNATPCSDMVGQEVTFQIFATSKQHVKVVLRSAGKVVYDREVDITPENILTDTVKVDQTDIHSLRLDILRPAASLTGKDQRYNTLLSWTPEPDEITPIPDAAEAALKPEEIKTNEQLFLTGLHLEQYRHATWSALDYYEEALRRDPKDVRCNNAMGLWYLRRGRFQKAEPYFRTAVKVLQKRNLNPYDGEPLYNLALCLKYQAMANIAQCTIDADDVLEEAYKWAYKSTWNAAWQQGGHMMCAQIATMRGDYEDALQHVEQSLLYGWHNHKARALKVAILKKLYTVSGDAAWQTKMQEEAAAALAINPFNYGVLFATGRSEEARQMMHGDVNNYEEIALDFGQAGLTDEAVEVLDMATEDGASTAMTYYYKVWLGGYCPTAEETMEDLPVSSLDYCFPNRTEAVMALSYVGETDCIATYLLGNLYYANRQYYLAQHLWEQAAWKHWNFPTLYRNLALVYYNQLGDADRALEMMEKAFALNDKDSRILMELDQLYKRLDKPYAERLAFLNEHLEEVSQRDDLILERATLLNQLGCYEDAMQIIDNHQFHVWEGGEGKVSGQYQLCRLEMAKQLIATDAATDADIDRAIDLLQQCLFFPANIGEGKLYGAQDNDFYFYLGKAYEKKGDSDRAREMYEKGTVGPTEPVPAMYYNDAKPEKIYYVAMCYRALGEENKARGLFNKLLSYGKQHIFDHITMDYFAVSLPDLLVWNGDLDEANRKHCQLMMELGTKGLQLTVHS